MPMTPGNNASEVQTILTGTHVKSVKSGVKLVALTASIMVS